MSGTAKSQLMHSSFSAGISQATDERLVEPPKLLDARNVRWRSAGALSKRFGTDTVIVGGYDPGRGSVTLQTTGATRLLPHRSGCVVLDGVYAVALSSASNTPSSVAGSIVDQAPPCRLTTKTIGGDTYTFAADITKGTTAGGYSFYAYALSDRVIILDATTGATIHTKGASVLGGSGLYSFQGVRLVMIGSTLCVLYRRAAAVIAIFTLNTSTWTWSTSTDLKTDNYADGVFDVCEFNSTNAILAYADNLNRLKAIKFTTAAAVSSTWTTTESSADPIKNIGVACQSAGRVWITYWLDNTVNLLGRVASSSDFSTTTFLTTVVSVATGSTPVFTAPGYHSSTLETCIYTYTTAGGVTESRANLCNTSGTLSSATAPAAFWCTFTSRPFTQNGFAYAFAGNKLLELRLDSSTLALTATARVLAPVGFYDPDAGGYGAVSVVSSGTGTWRSAGSVISYDILNSGFEAFSLLQVDLDFASTSSCDFATLGPSCYLSGMVMDGGRLLEHGLPKATIISASAAAGTGVAAGTYKYVATYSYMNAAGEWVEGAPSDVVTCTPGVLSDITVTVRSIGPTHTYDQHDQNAVVSVWLNVYRTVNGSSGPYYLVSRVANSAFTGSASIVDQTTDAALVFLHPLYTQLTSSGQAEMDNVQPPTFIATEAHGNRLFGIAPDKKTVWFSDQFQDGEQPRFHLELLLQVDDAEGIEALASQDGRLFAFSPSCIYVLDGLGPSRAYPGSDSDYRGFQRVASDVGCDQPQSILACHLGVLFRNSRRGLFLIDRKLNVQEVGADVQTYLETYDVTTATVLNPRAPLVHFFCIDSDGSEGRTLVFDYRHNTWSVDSYTCRTANAPIRSALSHGGELYFESGGYVYKEDRTTHLDDATTWVQLYARLAWIKAAGLQGHQSIFSVRVAWERNTAHDFYVLADHNYDNNSTQTSEVLDIETVGSESAGVSSWTNLPIAQFSFRPTISEDEAIGLTFYDTTPTGGGAVGTGKGPTLFAWTVDVAAKTQPFPLPKKQMR